MHDDYDFPPEQESKRIPDDGDDLDRPFVYGKIVREVRGGICYVTRKEVPDLRLEDLRDELTLEIVDRIEATTIHCDALITYSVTKKTNEHAIVGFGGTFRTKFDHAGVLDLIVYLETLRDLVTRRQIQHHDVHLDEFSDDEMGFIEFSFSSQIVGVNIGEVTRKADELLQDILKPLEEIQEATARALEQLNQHLSTSTT